METFCVEQRLIGAVGRDGPLKRAVALESFIVDSREHRRHRGNLIHDFSGVPIIPAGPEPVCYVLDDDPVRTAPFERFEHLIEPLYPALCTCEGAFLLEARTGGQNHVGKPAGLAEKDILHYEEIEFLECCRNIVGVRVDKSLLLTVQVHRSKRASMDSLDHLMVVETFG